MLSLIWEGQVGNAVTIVTHYASRPFFFSNCV